MRRWLAGILIGFVLALPLAARSSDVPTLRQRVAMLEDRMEAACGIAWDRFAYPDGGLDGTRWYTALLRAGVCGS